MIAYRLHFETLNLAAMDLARRGRLGELKFFTSSFSMTVRRGDIRTKQAYGGGTLYDIGIYCINAARNLFRAEPSRRCLPSPSIAGSRHLPTSTRRRPRRLDLGMIRWRRSSPASMRRMSPLTALSARRAICTPIPRTNMQEVLKYILTLDGKTTKKAVGKRDQFAPELLSLFRLHSERPRARTLRRGGFARCANRSSAVSIGENRQMGDHSAVRETPEAHFTTADNQSRYQKTGPDQRYKAQAATSARPAVIGRRLVARRRPAAVCRWGFLVSGCLAARRAGWGALR